MFPIGDDTGRRTAPVVTFALIALNMLVFFLELSGGDALIELGLGLSCSFLAALLLLLTQRRQAVWPTWRT